MTSATLAVSKTRPSILVNEYMMNKLPRFLGRLGRFAWTAHNLIAHPVSEVVHQLGFVKTAEWLHDVTTPKFEQYIVSFRMEDGTLGWLVSINEAVRGVVFDEAGAKPLTPDQVRLAQVMGLSGLTIKPYTPN